MKNKEIKINTKFGYFEVIPKPTEEELKAYYQEKYYQDAHGNYEKNYEGSEKSYFYNKVYQKNYIIHKLCNRKNDKSILDIGCGEGFTLNYYKQKGWNVTGIDFSSFGIKANNPQLLPYFKQGNIFEEINKLIENNKEFNVVWLDNVLEHVIDPQKLIQQCYFLTKRGGVFVVEVPNDYSDFQKALLNSKVINKKYWEAYPDHLSYFSYSSLQNLCESIGWKTGKIISDFPIEWFLSNEKSNYINNKVGKEAHKSRVFIENFLHNNQEQNMDNLIDFYESMAKIGQGRQIIGFFKKDEVQSIKNK